MAVGCAQSGSAQRWQTLTYETIAEYTEVSFLEAKMPNFIDKTGQKFGLLAVLGCAGHDDSGRIAWNCVCECGNKKIVSGLRLITGNTKSCGCLQNKIKHGGTGKSSYNTWRAMMRRCYRSTDKDYKRYGAIGIIVCEKWHDYVNFAQDMGEPEGAQTLDRIDPYGNYEPSNCRWADLPTQARNIRLKKNHKTGCIGVRQRNKKWFAEITLQKKKYTSKVCESFDEAVTARKELEKIYWGTPA